MKVYIHTLGCKVNQFESQAMETMLLERGHSLVSSAREADAIVVNTCSVTAESGRKSRQAVRRLAAENPGAVCAVCGCWSQIKPDDAASLGADLVSGSGGRAKFIDDLERVFEKRAAMITADDPMKRRVIEPLPAGRLSGRTRAMLKIQDGCSNFCAYCIIPYARGPVRSLPVSRAAAEAARLASEGCREIVVTGIEIASYGKDLKDGSDLASVAAAIAAAAPGVRLRLGSLEPRAVTDEFCAALSALGSVCPHFHLSLQSGCDATLARMRRKYDTARFYESVSLLRRYFPGCAIAADLITGFPGETEDEFSATLDFIEKCAFSSMHIFPFSCHPGTPAAQMDGQVEKAEKHSRAARAAELAERLRSSYMRSLVGTVQSVLFERERDGKCLGHTANYQETAVAGAGLRNKVLDVEITGVKDDILLGNLCCNQPAE